MSISILIFRQISRVAEIILQKCHIILFYQQDMIISVRQMCKIDILPSMFCCDRGYRSFLGVAPIAGQNKAFFEFLMTTTKTDSECSTLESLCLLCCGCGRRAKLKPGLDNSRGLHNTFKRMEVMHKKS